MNFSGQLENGEIKNNINMAIRYIDINMVIRRRKGQLVITKKEP